MRRSGWKSADLSEMAGNRISQAVVIVLLLVGTTSEARAYADPGTGALLWQSMIAVLAGAGYFWRKLGWFSKRNRGDKK